MSPAELRWLEDLRGLLVIGWLLLAGVWCWDIIRILKTEQKRPVEYCKLHARPLAQCPPGSHGT